MSVAVTPVPAAGLTLLDAILIIIVIAVVAFMLYYLLRGSKGNIEITRPIESRVDEYLDRKFEDIIERWSLVTQPRLLSFRQRAGQMADAEEKRLEGLKSYEVEMTTTLARLEERLDALEKDLVPSGTKKP